MPKKRTQGPKDPNKPTYQCDAGDCGFTTQWRIAIINHKRMKHGQMATSASDAPAGQGPSAPVPRPPAQAVDEPLDMRAKLRQVLTRAGVTQKLEAIATIMDDDPENPEHFWVTLSDARVPKLEKQLAFRLWFERSPQQVVDDGDMEEEVLDYKPGMALKRGSDDDDDFEDSEDLDDSFIGSQARMMKRQFRMEQMNLQLEQMRQTRRQLREDAALDRRERMMALGLTAVNPQTGQPVVGAAQATEPLVDYHYTPTGQMLRVTPSQMMAYERMRIESEATKRSQQPEPAKERRQRAMPDGSFMSLTDDEYNQMYPVLKKLEGDKAAASMTTTQRADEIAKLERAMLEQKSSFERTVQDMQRRHDDVQRQQQDRYQQMLNDQKTAKLEEEIKRTQQYVAGQANRDRVDEMVQTQKKLKDAGLTSSSAEEQKLGLEIQKVSKGLDMVGKRLDNVGNKTDKALDTFTEIVKAKAQRDMAAEHGPPAAQEEYEYGDASEPPPEEPKGSGEGGSEESGDDGGESGEEHESNLMS